MGEVGNLGLEIAKNICKDANVLAKLGAGKIFCRGAENIVTENLAKGAAPEREQRKHINKCGAGNK